MRNYRLYFIDQQNHIRGAAQLEAECDVAAVSQAEGHCDRGVLELWEGGRPVVRIEGGLHLPIVANADPKAV